MCTWDFFSRTVERGFVRGAAYICPRAIIDLKAIPRLLRPPFVSPRPVAPLAASPALSTYSLGAAIYSYRRHIRSIISKGVSTRLGEPEEQEVAEERMKVGGEGCFAGGKIFLTAFASPPTSDFSHSSLRSLPPFRGTFSTDACAFPDFISLGKIIVALARIPSGNPMCVRIYARLHGCVCISRLGMRLCVNDARTMVLNWRLTGEQ